MAVQQLQVLPSQDAYSVEYSSNSIAVKLEGGRSRFGLTKKNGVDVVNVEYDLNQEDYQYFWAFYNDATKRGALPFQSYLYLNSSDLTLHLCKFVPGSLRLVRQDGNKFVVAATLEVSQSA